eukprot:TRINITY_DN5688_c0_g1_i1.p1 TRINITY_DN5688_c0_g1~~TRINITY_DN5688_c0_g1_i1.p1  ORF type:complete len:335 (-),score=128.35 TRINITY_DN5688_c0_g1_i1:58-1062(-)
MEPPFEDIEFDVDYMLDENLKQKEQPRKVEPRLSKCLIVLTWLRSVVASLIIGNQTQWSVTQFGKSIDGPKWGNYQLSSWQGIDGATTEWMQALDESRKSATTVRVQDRQVSQMCHTEGLGRELGKSQLVWWFDEHCQLEMTPACQSEASLSCLLRNISEMMEEGGYLVGQCFDSSDMFARLAKQSMVPGQPRNIIRLSAPGRDKGEEVRVMRVTFADEGETSSGSGTLMPLSTVDCQFSVEFFDHERKYPRCYLVHFPTLIRLARLHGLRMVSITNCVELYEEYTKTEFMNGLNDLIRVEHQPFSFGTEVVQREQLQLYAIFVFVKAAAVTDL